MDPREAEAARLRRELRPQLGRAGTPLQILAEGVLGEEDVRIDWLALEPGGRVCVAIVDAAGGDETLLARALAQRAWVQARIADWLQLAPSLGARPELRPRLLLLAPAFSRVARIAAREADADGIRLVLVRWTHGHGGPVLSVQPLDPVPAPDRGDAADPPSPALVSVFRSGLSDRDFGGNGGRSGGDSILD